MFGALGDELAGKRGDLGVLDLEGRHQLGDALLGEGLEGLQLKDAQLHRSTHKQQQQTRRGR